jgi:hypothetical protein
MNTIATVLGVATAIVLAPWTFRTVGEKYRAALRDGPGTKKRAPSGRYTPPTKRRM